MYKKPDKRRYKFIGPESAHRPSSLEKNLFPSSFFFSVLLQNKSLAVVKNANVVPNRVDKYPITVTIEEEQLGMIYSGRQQGFFGKNGRPAMREVEEALRSKL